MIRKIIFWIAVIILSISIFSITVAPWLPVEFSDYRIPTHFYFWVVMMFPVAILLTLVRTVKKERSKGANIAIVVVTAFSSVIGLISIMLLLYSMSLGFGTWINVSVDYRNKENPENSINTQVLDQGALGYKTKRVVEIKPFTPLFNIVTVIDTTKLDKTQWKYVNEQGDIKFP